MCSQEYDINGKSLALFTRSQSVRRAGCGFGRLAAAARTRVCGGAALQGLIRNVSYDVSGGFLVASFSRVLAATSVESAVVLGRNLSGDVNMNW